MSQMKPKNKIEDVMQTIGLVSVQKMGDSSQGNLWRAASKDDPLKRSVIKVMNQDHISIAYQDLSTEQSILKYLGEYQDCPDTIVKFEHFFKNNQEYYLVIEDAGISLFHFVMRAHKLIRENKMTIAHWQKVTKVIFKQMIEAIAYIHSKNVCHFDVSLENFFINDVTVEVQSGSNANKIKFCTDSIRIKLSNFGLSELFTGSDCVSFKFCGKEGYKSPEIINRTTGFDAKMNDLWCLGVCLFMLVTGLAPWNTAHELDDAFLSIVKYKKMVDLLNFWGVRHYVNKDAVDIIQSIFDYEPRRAKLNDIKQHSFIQN